MKKFLKKAVAVVVMAAAVVATVPGLAQAGTYPTKDCPKASNGYHSYRLYCMGFSYYTVGTHKVYDSVWDRIFQTDDYTICNVKYTYHESMETCEYCREITGVRGSHGEAAIHMNCGEGIVTSGYCNGPGSDVTFLR
ncbi:MAG: hypothetical protein ACI4DW_01350 [Lachnospiraceae bacterium]